MAQNTLGPSTTAIEGPSRELYEHPRTIPCKWTNVGCNAALANTDTLLKHISKHLKYAIGGCDGFGNHKKSDLMCHWENCQALSFDSAEGLVSHVRHVHLVEPAQPSDSMPGLTLGTASIIQQSATMPCFPKEPLIASYLLALPMSLGVSMPGRNHHLQQVWLEESEAPFWPVHGECQSGFFAGFSGSIFKPNRSNDGGWDSQERLPDGQPVVPSSEKEGAYQFCVKKKAKGKMCYPKLGVPPNVLVTPVSLAKKRQRQSQVNQTNKGHWSGRKNFSANEVHVAAQGLLPKRLKSSVGYNLVKELVRFEQQGRDTGAVA